MEQDDGWRAVRAPDVDREAAAGRVARALGEDRLTVHEFDERLTAVHAARTLGAHTWRTTSSA